MKYIRNSNMEFLKIDNDNLAVYDNESGDTHYIDATGKAILEILEYDTPEDNLISQLCAMYDVTADEIAGDIHEFLNELVSKKVVICH